MEKNQHYEQIQFLHCSTLYFWKRIHKMHAQTRGCESRTSRLMCVNTIVSIIVCLISFQAFAFRQYFHRKFFAIIIFLTLPLNETSSKFFFFFHFTIYGIIRQSKGMNEQKGKKNNTRRVFTVKIHGFIRDFYAIVLFY